MLLGSVNLMLFPKTAVASFLENHSGKLATSLASSKTVVESSVVLGGRCKAYAGSSRAGSGMLQTSRKTPDASRKCVPDAFSKMGIPDD